jgi:hypothetical protein
MILGIDIGRSHARGWARMIRRRAPSINLTLLSFSSASFPASQLAGARSRWRRRTL